MKKRNFTIFLIIIFILSLIPLYYIAGYAHPSVDDYFYGAETAQIWHNTHSLGQVLQKSFVLMKDSYITWAGKFHSYFSHASAASNIWRKLLCNRSYYIDYFICNFYADVFLSFFEALFPCSNTNFNWNIYCDYIYGITIYIYASMIHFTGITELFTILFSSR